MGCEEMAIMRLKLNHEQRNSLYAGFKITSRSGKRTSPQMFVAMAANNLINRVRPI